MTNIPMAPKNQAGLSVNAEPSDAARRESSLEPNLMDNFKTFLTGGDLHDEGGTVPRLISPRGRRRVRPKNLPWTGSRLHNFYRFFVNLSWQLQLILMWLFYLLLVVFFGVIWYIVQKYEVHDNTTPSPEEWHCLAHVTDIYEAFMFSLITSTTVGYGYRYIKDDCYSAMGILWVQMLTTALYDAIVIAVILSKMTHPKLRQSQIYFSRSLTVSKRGNEYVLSVRMADMSDGIMPEAHVRMYLVHSQPGPDGKPHLVLEDLNVGYDTGLDRLILIVPWVVEHRINEKSPLYNKSWEDFRTDHFEVIVLLEGGVEETGNTAQIVKSYTADDVKWGHEFQNMLVRRGARYIADYRQIDMVVFQPDMPLVSLEQFRRQTGPGSQVDGGRGDGGLRARSVVYAGYRYNPESDPEN